MGEEDGRLRVSRVTRDSFHVPCVVGCAGHLEEETRFVTPLLTVCTGHSSRGQRHRAKGRTTRQATDTSQPLSILGLGPPQGGRAGEGVSYL